MKFAGLEERFKAHKVMVDKMVVHNALRRSWSPEEPAEKQDSFISLLIHDIFGGEILKTPLNNGWHFYNRIDGDRVDFTALKPGKIKDFKDIPATPDETCNYFEQVDYSRFLTSFVRAFEELIGLRRCNPSQELNLI